MARRMMMIGAALMLLGVATSASAETERREVIEGARDAVVSLGIDVAEQRVLMSDTGTEDIWVYARDRFDDVVGRMKQAFKDRRELDGGYKVVAHAKLGASGTYNFSVRGADGDTVLIQIMQDGARSVARIEGRIRSDKRPITQAKAAFPAPVLIPVGYTP